MWQVLTLLPRLQPLVASMGWDLLSGKTTARRNLMQLLWASKSQVLRLEESSLYGNQSDEVRNFYGNNSFGTIWSLVLQISRNIVCFVLDRFLVWSIFVITYVISLMLPLSLPVSILVIHGIQNYRCCLENKKH